MVSAWRRAFCTAIPEDQETKIAAIEKQQQQTNSNPSTPRAFAFFSNPLTPRPSLQCRTASSVDTISTASSCLRSSQSKSSSFSLLKNTLRPSKSRCGICLQPLKTGPQGSSTIFTSECPHAFHSSCITSHVNPKRHQSINFTCPACNYPSSLPTTPRTTPSTSTLKVYNDDEPLMSPSSSKTFVPIPENDEETFTTPKVQNFHVEISSNDTAVMSSSRSHETRVATVKIQASSRETSFRAPVDVVLVADVSERMNDSTSRIANMVRAMKVLMDCLDSRDRLSIVAFSACSKRVMNLRRMTAAGRRSARRIAEVIGSGGTGGVMSVNDAVRKAAKVLEDRKEKNPVSMIFVFSSNGQDPIKSKLKSNLDRPFNNYACTRMCQNIPVHAFGIDDSRACDENGFAKFISGLLSVVKDVRVQLGFNPGEVAAVYSGNDKPEYIGSDLVKLGDFHSDEVKELLMELRVPPGSQSHHVLTVRCFYEDFSSRGIVRCNEKSLLVPKPQAVRSCLPSIERLGCRFICVRAVAESKRLVERKDYSGASRLLSSARALLLQRRLSSEDELLRSLETELAELNRQKQQRQSCIAAEERGELLTPTSAWRAAERLAKVAKMRRSLNRVSDLHGFENARF